MDFLYNIFGFLFRILFGFISDYGIALIIFTVFFRLILLPSAVKQQKSQAKTVRLQPKLRRIREKYQDYSPQERQQKIQQETNELYQQEGYSSMTGGCLPLLVQMPILLGLYGVIRQPLKYVLEIPAEAINQLTEIAKGMGLITEKSVAFAEPKIIDNLAAILEKAPELATSLGEYVSKIEEFDFTMFGMSLGAVPKDAFAEGATLSKWLILIPILSAATSLMTSLLTQIRQKKANPNMDNQQMMGCMMLSMPLMSLWFTYQYPVGMGLYWIFSNILAFLQTLVLGHFYAPRKTVAKLMVDETIERRSYEKAKITAYENQIEE